MGKVGKFLHLSFDVLFFALSLPLFAKAFGAFSNETFRFFCNKIKRFVAVQRLLVEFVCLLSLL